MYDLVIQDPFFMLATLVNDIAGDYVTELENMNEIRESIFKVLCERPPWFPKLLNEYTKNPPNPIEVEIGEKLLRFLWRKEHTIDVVPGAYKSFDGNFYTVEKLGFLHLENSSNVPAVIYFKVPDEKKTLIRSVRSWKSIVKWPDDEYHLKFMPINRNENGNL